MLKYAMASVFSRRLGNKTFKFQGKEYRYFHHPYNVTWRTERAVEIPIVESMLGLFSPKKTLEVGNVLSHYFNVTHDILDKYETGDRVKVMNADVVDLTPKKKYDLIISISTLEHVGWDEHVGVPDEKREPQKVVRALEAMNNALSDNGMMMVTLPIGWNANLDRMIENDSLPFLKLHFLKRISWTKWREASKKEVIGTKYGTPYSFANAVVFGSLRRTKVA